MRVLVVGAGGFIGSRVARALEEAGCRVTRGGRPSLDLARGLEPHAWEAHLEGIDVVVNAAGIARETQGGSFEAVHALGPAALFRACARKGVKVVQVSALGADAQAATPFHLSKRAGDEALLALDVPSIVLQPSLVFGDGGSSARLFAMLASLPLTPLPGAGGQAIQPVHVDDLARAVVAAVRGDRFPRARIAAVGPHATTLRDFLADLREALGLGRARFLAVPERLVQAAARFRVGLLDPDTWSMLRRGNVASPEAFGELIGRAPRALAQALSREEADSLRREALLGWLLPLLRISIALVWIVTGVVSAGLFPVAQSLELLRPVGLTGALAYAALYAAAALDIAIGVATLAMKRRRALWLLQVAVVLGYTAIITVFLPGQWLHPYGPVLKNVPLLGAIVLLHQMERR